MGLAWAKTMGSLAMLRIMSSLRELGADTPMKTSAPLMASARPPLTFSGLVRLAISSL